jgi:hypothetical protein
VSTSLKMIHEALSKLLLPQMLRDLKAREKFHKWLMGRLSRNGGKGKIKIVRAGK